jgi:Hypothetical glycosyl hydrolase family 15
MELRVQHHHQGFVARTSTTARVLLLLLALAGAIGVSIGLAYVAQTLSEGASDRARSAARHAGSATSLNSTPPPAGVVRFEKDAKSAFDREDKQANAAWMLKHFTRMLTYSPFFDSRTAWYPNAWTYADSYAIYSNSTLASKHGGWILKDTHGNPLYIPYGSSSTQYAADISNPEYRKYWIATVKSTLAKGYKGVTVDDVNMWADTGNAKGEKVTPISGITHRAISDEQWREYMVTFMAELRAAIPTYEIVHNSVWYEDGGSANRGTTSPIIRREIEAANVIEIERGFNDAGLTGGSGPWSVANLLTYIEEVHAMGKGVLLTGETAGVAAMEYNLVGYFLASNGTDYVNGGGSTQNVKHFWQGWSTNLGAAKGARYIWNGLIRRDFEGGSVYLNPPGGAPVSIGGVTLPGGSAKIVASS